MAALEKKKFSMVYEDGVYRHAQYMENVYCTQNGAESLHQVFIKAVQDSPSSQFLGTIKDNRVEYITYLDGYNRVRKIYSFIKGMNLDEEEIIGIFSVNREEWIISEQAILMADATSCPLYSTLGVDSIKHIINETNMRIMFVSGEKAEYLYEKILSSDPNGLEVVISYDHISEKMVACFADLGISVYFFDEIYENSTEKDIKPSDLKAQNARDVGDGFYDSMKVLKKIRNESRSKPDDVVSICYTSGTCGKPKGAMLTNRNFVSSIAAFARGDDNGSVIEVNNSVVYISYLPLAHAMEKICVYVIISVCARIAFYGGNPKNLQQDIKIIRPSFLVGVPRVFNVFKEKIEEKVNERGCLTRFAFYMALKYKKWKQRSGSVSSYIVDRFIFKKIAAEFGGNIRFGLSGSAPLNPDVCSFLQSVFSMKLYEGYGQTEALAANILKPPQCHTYGTVGIPFPSNMVKLIPSDIPDQYEILLKGDNVFKGYYKNPEKTAEVLDSDGWLHTGDLGIVKEGLFYIVGRRKEIFKTSLGEYIVPEKLEGLYKKAPIDDILITGKTCGDYIVGIVVCTDNRISKDEIKEKIQEIGQNEYLKGKITKFEIPRDIHVVREEWTIDDGFITPTGKKRRAILEEHYKNEVESMYKK
ncbi:Long-chain acyl-CoA synthetases (AMP-forming) [Trachipleistophora hominis]|uniref:Long-chain acyl-CoA synthetases (AMP-forming) n=1 Tax=Trachipleistophora hominis TaxID=72359 RepID=L7JTQ3_TRAHO|nr:Long-chain acyl-CoA synthetases (AMP-forming) [Trachipleistophora hominis]